MAEQQKRAIEKLLKTSDLSDTAMGKIMIDSGYSESTSKKPKVLTESKAYQELVIEAKQVVADVMRSGKKDDVRLKAAQDIIDRAEGKATQKTQQSGELTITVVNYEDKQE